MSSTGSRTSPPPSRWQAWWRNPSNWIALLTLLGVFVYTGVQIWQTSLIRSNNIVSQRAFVYVGSNFTPLSAFAGETKAPVVYIFNQLINGGNTPTKDLHFLYRCAPSVDALPEPWVLLYQGTPEKVPMVLGPKASTAMGCYFTVTQLKDMEVGKLHGYVMAEIFYEDFLDLETVHRTQYSQEMTSVNLTYPPNAPTTPNTTNAPNTPSTAGNPGTLNPQFFAILVPRGKHNCTDDDCPK
jgi:hypothetical protein